MFFVPETGVWLVAEVPPQYLSVSEGNHVTDRQREGDAIPIQEVRLEPFDHELHSQMLREWLHRPHVAQWWGDPQPAMESSQRFPPEKHAVIAADGSPVGYLCWQTPPQDELEAAGLADLPEDLVDIDICIGETDFIDREVGPRSLGLLLARLRADPSVSFAGVGTSVSNKRAIRAFEKTGFRLFREFYNPEFGSCLYMVEGVGDVV